MAVFMDLKGTTKDQFRIGKSKFNVDASTASALRQLALGNADISFASPTNGQVMQYNGVSWVPATLSGGPTNGILFDTTTLNFDATSPVAMFTLPANNIIKEVRVIIDTPFDGTPTLNVGITGTTNKYLDNDDVDLVNSLSGDVWISSVGALAPGSNESIIATYVAGSATVGSARIIAFYGLAS